jgi:hypothetical protein
LTRLYQSKNFNQITKEKDQAINERDRIIEEKDRATDRIIKERNQVIEERDQAIKERDRITKERDRVINEKDRITEERDQVTEERDQVTEERDRITEERDQVTEEKNRLEEVVEEKNRSLNKAKHAYEQAAQEFEEKIVENEEIVEALQSEIQLIVQDVKEIRVFRDNAINMIEEIPKKHPARQFIRSRLSQNFTVTEAAELLQIHPSTISRSRKSEEINPMVWSKKFQVEKPNRFHDEEKVKIVRAWLDDVAPVQSGRTWRKSKVSKKELFNQLQYYFAEREHHTAIDQRLRNCFPIVHEIDVAMEAAESAVERETPIVYVNQKVFLKILGENGFRKSTKRDDCKICDTNIAPQRRLGLTVSDHKDIWKCQEKYYLDLKENKLKELCDGKPFRILVLEDFTQINHGSGVCQDLIQVFYYYKWIRNKVDIDELLLHREYHHHLSTSANDNNFVAYIWDKYTFPRLEELRAQGYTEIFRLSDGCNRHFKQAGTLRWFSEQAKNPYRKISEFSFFCSNHGHNVCDAAARHAKQKIIEYAKAKSICMDSLDDVVKAIETIKGLVSAVHVRNIPKYPLNEAALPYGVVLVHKWLFEPTRMLGFKLSSDSEPYLEERFQPKQDDTVILKELKSTAWFPAVCVSVSENNIAYRRYNTLPNAKGKQANIVQFPIEFRYVYNPTPSELIESLPVNQFVCIFNSDGFPFTKSFHQLPETEAIRIHNFLYPGKKLPKLKRVDPVDVPGDDEYFSVRTFGFANIPWTVCQYYKKPLQSIADNLEELDDIELDDDDEEKDVWPVKVYQYTSEITPTLSYGEGDWTFSNFNVQYIEPKDILKRSLRLKKNKKGFHKADIGKTHKNLQDRLHEEENLRSFRRKMV